MFTQGLSKEVFDAQIEQMAQDLGKAWQTNEVMKNVNEEDVAFVKKISRLLTRRSIGKSLGFVRTVKFQRAVWPACRRR